VLSRWSIQNKLLICVTMLLLAVVILAVSGFQGAYCYRQLVRAISERAIELPLSANLTASVTQLRDSFQTVVPNPSFPYLHTIDALETRQEFDNRLTRVEDDLARYRNQLETTLTDPHIGDRQRERDTVKQIEQSIARIKTYHRDQLWMEETVRYDDLKLELENLSELAAKSSYLHDSMEALVDDVRLQYRAWIVVNWVSIIFIVLIFCVIVKFVYDWIFQPLRVLVDGSRRVAGGDFQHRIHLRSHDELAELAHAINGMTTRFQEIRDDLDRQVQERTREVVRSEQLASVGFLAAGVAHEINNPLASIAWCAEALESRIGEQVQAEQHLAAMRNEEYIEDETVAVLQNYLRKIQNEAFRCKGITEKLLDFSRSGDVERHSTDLRELVQDVIDMVQHMGKYREKSLEFRCHQTVIAAVNEQEIKQVILNLITNALDSLDPGGAVTIHLVKSGDHANLLVQDNGCGMTEEVLEHLFEPFYTNRRDGQGTGLGLSITYRIVTEHGGRIEASSLGPGCGSEFRVTLPVVHHEEAIQHEQAA